MPVRLEVVEVEGKGLGVIAAQDIQRHEFVCEYKYNLSYPRHDKTKWEAEYSTNGEGCYIIKAQLPSGKWYCLFCTISFAYEIVVCRWVQSYLLTDLFIRTSLC